MKGAGWRPQRRLSRRHRRVALGLLRVVINRAMAMVTRLFRRPSHNKPRSTARPSSATAALLSRPPDRLENLLCTNHAVHRPGVIFAGGGFPSYDGVDSALHVYDPARYVRYRRHGHEWRRYRDLGGREGKLGDGSIVLRSVIAHLCFYYFFRLFLLHLGDMRGAGGCLPLPFFFFDRV